MTTSRFKVAISRTVNLALQLANQGRDVCSYLSCTFCQDHVLYPPVARVSTYHVNYSVHVHRNVDKLII